MIRHVILAILLLTGLGLAINSRAAPGDKVISVPDTRTVNGKRLNADITLNAADVGADTSGASNTVNARLSNYSSTHTVVTPMSHGNERHTSTFITGADAVSPTTFKTYTGAYLRKSGGTMTGTLNITAPSAHSAPRNVYLMGDSLTSTSGKYGTTLQSLLGTSNWTVNWRGVGGNTTAQMRARFIADVITPGNGEYVVIWGGVNDIAQGVATATTTANLQWMYDTAHAYGLKVISVNITPFCGDAGWDSCGATAQAAQATINTWISNTARNIDYHVDAWTVMRDPNDTTRLLPAYDSGDHIHFNSTGDAAAGTAIYNGATWTAQHGSALAVTGNASISGVTTISGALGVGKSPAYPIDINGPINATDILQNGVSVASQWSAATGGINYSSGNVGIGASAPSSLLELSAATPKLTLRASSISSPHGIELYTGSTLDAYVRYQPNIAYLSFNAGRGSGWGGSMHFLTDGTEAMSIGSTGTVTIPGTLATGAISLVGNMTANSYIATGITALSNTAGTTGARTIRLKNNSADTYWGIEGSTAGEFFAGSLAYSTVLYTTTAIQNIIGGTSRTIIDTSGNFGIGLTALGTSAAKALGIADGTAPAASVSGAQIWSEAATGLNIVPSGSYTAKTQISATNLTIPGKITMPQTQTISGSKTLTDNTATGIFEIALGTNSTGIGGYMSYSVTATDGSAIQAHSGYVNIACIRDSAASVTSDIKAAASGSEATVSSTPSLTENGWTITNGTGKCTINANFDSSLTSPTITLKYQLTIHGSNAVTQL